VHPRVLLLGGRLLGTAGTGLWTAGGGLCAAAAVGRLRHRVLEIFLHRRHGRLASLRDLLGRNRGNRRGRMTRRGAGLCETATSGASARVSRSATADQALRAPGV